MGRATGRRIVALLFLLSTAFILACNGDGTTPPTPSPPLTPSTSPRTPSPPPTPSTSPTPAGTVSPHPTARVPDRDLFDLAVRFGQADPSTPRTAQETPPIYKEGDIEEFVLVDPISPALSTVRASLRLITDHAYFFFQEGTDTDPDDLAKAGRDFESLVYPTVTDTFGQEWSPGVDGDPRITILHAHIRGAGGYFSAADEFPKLIVPRSNEREMIYANLEGPRPGTSAYNALIAHELQHLAHWNADPGEEAWVNEGLSQLASELVGGGTGPVFSFLPAPDTQLNTWVTLEEDTGPHYGGSQLFFRYLLDRFGGRQRALDIVKEPEDGSEGINEYLSPFGTSFEEVFADWIVANYLDEPEGPYSHSDADLQVSQTTFIDSLSSGEDSVHQFGADYLEVQPPAGGAVLAFDGSDEVPLIPVQPHSGQGFWWSTRGDSVDSRLSREFDLRGVDAATLNFWTWYEIEEGWDYAYVAVSTNGGETWQALPGQQSSDYNPVELAYSPGYTGKSGAAPGTPASKEAQPRWVKETVDLTPFAGQSVLLRFEYVTDDAANLAGFAIDDVSIPDLGFFDDAEDDRDWQAEGFLRIHKPLPQKFILWLIDRSGDRPDVRRISLDASNRTSVPLSGPATIVVAAATEGTTEPASYRWTLAAP